MKRVNIIFENATYESLEKVPRGDRSRVVNEAVAKYFADEKREKAHIELEKSRAKLSSLKTDVVAFLRRDRAEGH